MDGISLGWKMIFFSCVSALVMTPARPTSEPVPAVVGTAMMGAMASAFARVQLSPTSSKSHRGRSWPAIMAITLPASSAEPPPMAMTPSIFPEQKTSAPFSMFSPTGLGLMSAKTFTPSPSAASWPTISAIIGMAASPGSVTSSGFSMPSSAHMAASSPARPGPKRTDVG